MNQDVAGRQLSPLIPSTINLPYSALDLVTNHGPANFASNGYPEPRTLCLLPTPQYVQGHQPAVLAAPPLVAAHEIGSSS